MKRRWSLPQNNGRRGPRIENFGGRHVLSALGATVIDMTDVKATDSSNDNKFAEIADVWPHKAICLVIGRLRNVARRKDTSEIGA